MPDAILSSDLDAFITTANDAAARAELGLTALATTTPAAGIATFLATPSSANLAAAVTNETGTGLLVFNDSPQLLTPDLVQPTVGTNLITGSTTFSLLPTVATTVNFANVATTLNIGAGAATVLNFGGFTSAAELRFLEPSGSGTNYSGFKQGALGTSITYTLPSDAPVNGDVLTAQASGALSWETPSGAANAVTLASAAAGAGLMIVSAGADRTATATDTVTTINATTVNADTVTFDGATVAVRPAVKITASNYTIGTTDPNELYGGVIYVTGAATITIPAVAAGASFTVITIGDVAVSVDPNAADLIYLDGTALSDGDKITNLSTAGDMAVFTYYDATGWAAQTNGWTDTN